MRHTCKVLGALTSRGEEIAEACRRFGATSLTVFGSAATDTYRDDSDVDLLVTFASDSHLSRFDAYFGLKEALEGILERPVDLVTPSALDNPYFASTVETSRVDLYAA
jgi:predicted nucleotidyltransferase